MRTVLIASLIAFTVAGSFAPQTYAQTAGRSNDNGRTSESREGKSRGDYYPTTHVRKRPRPIPINTISGAYCSNRPQRMKDDYGNIYFKKVRHCDDRRHIEVK